MGILEFTPLEFETFFVWALGQILAPIRIYSVGVWNNINVAVGDGSKSGLEFTPLEFETGYNMELSTRMKQY